MKRLINTAAVCEKRYPFVTKKKKNPIKKLGSNLKGFNVWGIA